MMLNAARKIHAARPDSRFLVAAFQRSPRRRDPRDGGCERVARRCVRRRTPEVIEQSDACVAVSGSVSLGN